MAQTQIFYDRVEISIDGVDYLPDGLIQNFRASMTTQSKLVDSMTPTSIKIGKVQGNSHIFVDWTEILPPESQYINLYLLLNGNPNLTISVTPFSIATGAQSAPNFIITGLIMPKMDVDVSGTGTEAKRSCSFEATTCGGLNT